MVEDNYNQFMGGEWGAEFTDSSSVYCHGMMTLQRTLFGSDITKKGTIFYYNNICPWLQQIGYDEMLSHRFVTPDHLIQETAFSSGKRAVVNFGNNEYIFEGKIIKAKGFIVI